jgi:hypothetical protein
MKQVDDKWGRRMLVIQIELMDARMDEEDEREGRRKGNGDDDRLVDMS